MNLLTVTVSRLILAIPTVHAEPDKTIEALFLEQARGYGVLVPQVSSQDSLDYINRYYIVRYLEKDIALDPLFGEFTVIDSIEAHAVGACDTNAFAYTTLGPEETHLVRITLSPNIVRDTLLSMANDLPGNWLQSLRMVDLSGLDSTLFRSILDYRKRQMSVEIIKILPGNEYEALHWLPNQRGAAMSHDFNQFLFIPEEPTDSSDCPGGIVLIYDIATDSLRICDICGSNNLRVRRRCDTCPIFSVKESENGLRDLWAIHTDGTLRQLTFSEYPMSVRSFRLYEHEIHYEPMNLEDPRDTSFPLGRLKE